jgi:uncharacterized circularly permuted ATP-grasp superfamily protein/uncharacterized alpha-E superfamily protein
MTAAKEVDAMWFAPYAAAAGKWDELRNEAGEFRGPWEAFQKATQHLSAEEVTRRWEQAQRGMHESGITRPGTGGNAAIRDVAETSVDVPTRPWMLDPLPFMIDSQEWESLSVGLIQRAQLLDKMLADLYGPQELLTTGVLPPDLLFAHPGFQRAYHGLRPYQGKYLQLYAADLIRTPAGKWRVVADRTDAPIGAGYALENRVLVSRMLPEAFQRCRVQRLAPFFIEIRRTLESLSPQTRDNPRVVLLSSGGNSPRYLEDAYLARYLGYTLVEGGDLTVRNNRVMLKTLGGLLQVDVIFRRINDSKVDPLELDSLKGSGVAGLVQAVQAGNVSVANALGAGLVESPAMLPFMPAACEHLLGQTLKLPSIETWWCGQDNPRAKVLADPKEYKLRAAYRRDPFVKAGPDGTPAAADPTQLVNSQPLRWVGTKSVPRSTSAAWNGEVVPVDVAWRVFLVATKDGFDVMPGGLVRFADSETPLEESILFGKGSKDTWVLTDGPVSQVSLLAQRERQMPLRRGGPDLPSRVADNLFWFGRQTERAEASARLLRTLIVRLTSELAIESMPEVSTLLTVLAEQGLIEPDYVVDGLSQRMPDIDSVLPGLICDATVPASLHSMAAELHRLGSRVRDIVSLDAWRLVTHIEQTWAELNASSLGDLIDPLNETILHLAALGGMVSDSMTRSQGWSFLAIGRAMERTYASASLLQRTLVRAEDWDELLMEAVLEISDSLMTYRSRYLANVSAAPVLDLLLCDETNPRSLVFQLSRLSHHVDALPRDPRLPHVDQEQRLAAAALHTVRMAEVDQLATERGGERHQLDRMLGRLLETLPKLSNAISHRYLVHTGSRQVSFDQLPDLPQRS